MKMAEDESLEIILNKATNPANREEDWEYITSFCDQVNKELEGPQIAVRLLAHKIQSPQEREAIYALSITGSAVAFTALEGKMLNIVRASTGKITTLESCVKNCGRRFHMEIGKFKFLNELIKVVSPKYLGNKTSEKVKKRCIELMYSWSKGLSHEVKIEEAYKMLKQQGIVKEDPTYIEKTLEVFPPPKPRVASFEDEEKSKLLQKLLQSKNPHDLQAANRLIKNMVKQDADKMERVSKRINELETINNNCKLLMEMLEHFSDETSSSADRDMMKELYESLEKLRPNLFRLASDTDEKDNGAITDILKSNDEVMQVMSLYQKKVGANNNNQNGQTSETSSSLLDLADQSTNKPSPTTNAKDTSTEILDEELLALGLGDSSNKTESLLGDLDDIFAATTTSSTSTAPVIGGTFSTSGQPAFQQLVQPVPGPIPNYTSISQPLMQGPPTIQSTQVSNPLLMGSSPGLSAFSNDFTRNSPQKPPPSQQQQQAMADLDLLGQNLLQQNLPKDLPIKPQDTGQKLSLNQMVSKSPSVVPAPGAPSSITGAPAELPVSQPSQSLISTPSTTPVKPTTDVQPLTDVFVPLEAVQPSSSSPLNAYDKNGLKIVIHLAKNKPREDVTVMVISTISTNTNPVKNFVFQAAVPKVMKVKLQPPSATDLPAYNPILPPAAITQVMLLANPQKEKVRLKFKITYSSNDEGCTDVGEVDNFTES